MIISHTPGGLGLKWSSVAQWPSGAIFCQKHCRPWGRCTAYRCTRTHSSHRTSTPHKNGNKMYRKKTRTYYCSLLVHLRFTHARYSWFQWVFMCTLGPLVVRLILCCLHNVMHEYVWQYSSEYFWDYFQSTRYCILTTSRLKYSVLLFTPVRRTRNHCSSTLGWGTPLCIILCRGAQIVTKDVFSIIQIWWVSVTYG